MRKIMKNYKGKTFGKNEKIKDFKIYNDYYII